MTSNSNNPEDTRQNLVEPAKSVISDGVDFWANDRPADGTNEPVTGRKQKSREIMGNREEYRELYRSSTSKFGSVVAEAVKDSDFETTAGAIIYLAAAGYKDRGNDSELIGDNYDQKSPEVAQFVLEINKYSKLDNLSDSQIVELVKNEEDELYQLLEREVSATQQSIQDLNVPESALENDIELSFLQTLLTRRQEKMTRAVQEYVADKSLHKILEELEEAIIETGEAARTREDVIETVESEITDLETRLVTAVESQREQFASDVEDMMIELEAELLSASEFEDELASLETELQWAFREHRELLIEELSDQMDESPDQLTSKEMIALLSEQRDDIVNSIEKHLTQSQNQIEGRLDDLSDKQRQLNAAISDIEQLQNQVPNEEVKTLIQSELGQLTDQRNQLGALIDRFEQERERLEAEVTSLQDTPTPPEPVGATGDEISGTDVIPADVARLYEDDFIARIERSVREAAELTLPGGDTLTPEAGYWDGSSRSERGSFQGNLISHLPEDAQVRQYPERPWTRFATVESTGLLGQAEETELVIEGLTVTRLSTYADHGYDWAPATLAELHEVVGEALDRSLVRGQTDAHHLLIIGSATGWDDQTTKEVKDGALFDADVSVCLTDLRADEPHYHQRDALLQNNRHLLSLNLFSETVPDAEATIKTEYATDASCERVRLEEVVHEYGYESHVVKLAFDNLEERGIGSQFETEHGLVLSFGTH